MGTEKRLALWVVGSPDEVEGVARLGVDPLDAAFDVDALIEIGAAQGGTVKTMLASQSLIAGVRNAYSDEALHVARLPPFKRASALRPRRGGSPARHAGVGAELTHSGTPWATRRRH